MKAVSNRIRIKAWILGDFDAAGLHTEEGPDVAVGAHASDPHYGPRPETAARIRKDDLLLLDVWGKLKTPGSVYYDVTWVGYLGEKVPRKYAKVFRAVRERPRQSRRADSLQRLPPETPCKAGKSIRPRVP